MSVTSDDLDRLMKMFPPGRRAPRLPLKLAESKPDRCVLYRQMSLAEWGEAMTPIPTTPNCDDGRFKFDFRKTFETYQTGQYARVWMSTELAKVRGFNNAAGGAVGYVYVQFVFKQDVTELFKGIILPQKKKGAQHTNTHVLMHREGYEPYLHGQMEVKMFETQEEVTVTLARHKAFDLGFSSLHATKLNEALDFARLMED